MVIELVSLPGWGGLAFGLDFVGENLAVRAKVSSPAKPWLIFEASALSVLYPPALSQDFRQAMSCGRVLWMHALEAKTPELIHVLLESGLFEGLLVRNLENFSKSTPAAIWGRRWQLAAQRSGTHLLWLHSVPQSALLGFDVRLHWTAPHLFEIKRGHGYFESGKKISGNTYQPAA